MIDAKQTFQAEDEKIAFVKLIPKLLFDSAHGRMAAGRSLFWVRVPVQCVSDQGEKPGAT